MNSKTDSALIYWQMALKLSRELRYYTGEVNSQKSPGYLFATSGNYPKALENFLLTLKIAETKRDNKGISMIYKIKLRGVSPHEAGMWRV